jgi:hypothetical protein
VACFSCRSENVKAFTSEINIRFPGKTNLTESVLASPKLLVCMDCGLADVLQVKTNYEISRKRIRRAAEKFSRI